MSRRLPSCSCSRGGNASTCECNSGVVFDVEAKDEDGTWVVEASFWTRSAAYHEAEAMRDGGQWLDVHVEEREAVS